MTKSRGPVPKRSDHRRRVNEAGSVEKVVVGGFPASVPALRDGIHPLAARWYASLGDSAQSRFYEPSDWMMAQIVAEAIDSYAKERKAMTLVGILNGASLLLATEGDRRRMRLELQREPVEGVPVKVPSRERDRSLLEAV